MPLDRHRLLIAYYEQDGVVFSAPAGELPLPSQIADPDGPWKLLHPEVPDVPPSEEE